MAKKTSEIFTNNPPPFISESEMSFLLESDKAYTVGVKDDTLSERKIKEYQKSTVRRFMNITGEDLDLLLVDENHIDEDEISISDEEEDTKEEVAQEDEEEEKEEEDDDGTDEDEDAQDEIAQDDEDEEEKEEEDDDETDEDEDTQDEIAQEDDEEDEKDYQELEDETEEEEFEEVEEEEREFEEEDEILKVVLSEDEKAKEEEEEENEEELFEYTANFVAPWYKSKLILLSILGLFLLLIILNTITVLNFIEVDPSELPTNVMSFPEEGTIILKDKVQEEILNDILSKDNNFDKNITTTTNDNQPSNFKASVSLDDLMIFPKFSNYKDITYIKISIKILTSKQYVSIIKNKKMLLKEVVYKEICNMAEKRDSKAMPLNRKIIEILMKRLNSLFKTNAIKDIKIINFEIKRK